VCLLAILWRVSMCNLVTLAIPRHPVHTEKYRLEGSTPPLSPKLTGTTPIDSPPSQQAHRPSKLTDQLEGSGARKLTCDMVPALHEGQRRRPPHGKPASPED
jgi:hypothetical protein